MRPLRDMEKLFPDDWLRLVNDSGHELNMRAANRGSFSHGTQPYSAQAKPVDQLRVRADNTDETNYFGSVGNMQREVMLHELGHRMEGHVPGLREMEFTLVRRRSTSQGQLETPRQMQAAPRGEVSYHDEWRSPYTGRTYEDRVGGGGDPARQSWEVFQTGLQSAVAGNDKYEDEELNNFVWGSLLTLGRSQPADAVSV